MEAVQELAVGLLQGIFGVDVDEAGIVDDGEEHITKFLFDMGLVGGWILDLGFQLAEFLLYLVPDLFAVVPIKTDTTDFILNAVGFGDRRHTRGDAAQYGTVPFGLQFNLLPVLVHLIGGVGLDFAIDMRMTTYQLVAQLVKNILHFKELLFGSDFGVEDDMEHQVSKLLAHVRIILLDDGIRQLKGLLHSKVAQRVEGLLTIPRALLPQLVHDL